jgi:hypothetical protein
MAYDSGKAVIPDIAEGFAAAAKTSGQAQLRAHAWQQKSCPDITMVYWPL